ncbi:helix-turn-helix domain-containing protein [Bilophila wadsworthia]|uniref:helix-turn-helix domain-containing protein n=1 Tax=Bilophila wadsworthia TaxID=35833 RepID=UPI002676E709|nr:helix-turn-helix transcriptional regulator [Bilophila wadsworthia]
MSMNLRHMGFNEALDAAKQRSGLTNEAIANRSSLSTAAVSRYFNKYDDYTPSPELIPVLCRALGNTIIADWIAAQVEDMHPATNITTTEDLTRAVMQATENTGILNKKTLDAVADGELSPSEAVAIQAQFRANAKWNNEAADALDPLAGGQAYRHGHGFVTVPVLDGRPR